MSFESDAGYQPDTVNYGIFWLLKVGDPADWVRVWSGARDRRVAADSTDTAGGVYTGLNFPLEIPDFEICLNGQTGSGEFTMSGVGETAIRLLGVERDACQGAAIHLALQDFDREWQPIGSPTWLFEAIAARPKTSRQGLKSEATYTISLPWQNEFYDREEAALAYWGPSSQQRRSSGDRFMDRIPSMAERDIIDWPS